MAATRKRDTRGNNGAVARPTGEWQVWQGGGSRRKILQDKSLQPQKKTVNSGSAPTAAPDFACQLLPPLLTVPKSLVTTDIRGQMILLGTGTSVGVPAIGCGCPICQSTNQRNNRTRASVILGLPEGNLLVDTSPDLRQQLLRERIGLVHAVVYTHEHADHVFGLDDLRLMQFYLNGPVPLYVEPVVERRIRQSYDYAFAEEESQSLVPQLELHSIGLEPFDLLGAHIVPFRLHHGRDFEVLGFRFGNVAYCTDTNSIPPESEALLQGLDVLILDALRLTPSSTHFTLDQAIEVATRIGAKQTFFTHIAHELEYEETNARLPAGMALAYDGMRIPLT